MTHPNASNIHRSRETLRRQKADCIADEVNSRIFALLESLPNIFFAVDAVGCLLYVNTQAVQFFQKKRQSLIGAELSHVLPASLRQQFMAEYHCVISQHKPAYFDCLVPAMQRWFEITITETYPPSGVSVMVTDVSARKRVEEEQGRLIAILEATTDLVGINDMYGKICYFNRAGRQMLGLEDPAPPSDIVIPDASDPQADQDNKNYSNDRNDRNDDERDNEEGSKIIPLSLSAIDSFRLQDEIFPIGLEHGIWEGEKTLKLGKDELGQDKAITVSQVVIPHHGPDGKVAYLSTIARDISESKRVKAQMQQNLNLILEQKAELERNQQALIDANQAINETNAQLAAANQLLEAQATTDGLTGLKNHRAFQQRLTEEFDRSARYNAPLSLMMLDVDKFKQFNDTYGHPAGDEVLKAVAHLLSTCARTTDFVARYGGEEFVIVLSGTDLEGASEAAERVRSVIESAAWDKRPITVSIGVSSMRNSTKNTSMLIEEADRSLYISKELGRNRVTHFDTLLDSLILGGIHDPEEDYRADCA